VERIKATDLLAELRYDADKIITNAAGERVWIKQVPTTDKMFAHLTDCCPAEYPCEYHAALTHQQVKLVQ
jgi:hypothetical protein